MKLICPICNQPLVRVENSCKCMNGHVFDFSKEGYVNLLRKESKVHGDDKEMVKARTSFLETGAYAFLRTKLNELIQKEDVNVLVDLGCGEGYYTSAFAGKEKYGFDLSKYALKYAAKHDPSIQYCVSSIFKVPMESESVDTIVTCFAPIASLEIERLLKPSGRLIVVTPGENHLLELKQLLYDNVYPNRVKELEITLQKEREETISSQFEVDNQALKNLFQMTPYAYRTSLQARDKLSTIHQMNITASFVIRVYRK